MNATTNEIPTLRMIYTKYHGPTNRIGSRYSATSAGGSRIYVAYDDALSADENARLAADRMCEKITHPQDAGRFVLVGTGASATGSVWAYAYRK